MCLFPRNAPIGSKIDKYECGTCPECLAKRAKQWALRCCMEAKYNVGMMLTLTYDNYIRDGRGNIVGEQVDTRPVSKRDCQLFIKRLRKHYTGVPIKYLITAEYGKRTHRSHYHCLIFGVQFSDLIKYKRSKRGNIIYRSNTLEKIWHNGICTVDSINITACTARYCTKYCAKDGRCDDTFMLFSRGIGDYGLRKYFNGKSYIIDGREYPIPRLIWQWYISQKYAQLKDMFTTKYISFNKIEANFFRDIGSQEVVDTEAYFQCIVTDQERRQERIKNGDISKKLFDECFFHNYNGIFRQFKPIRSEFYYSRWRPYIAYARYKKRSLFYRYLRDNDVVYKNYIRYWNKKVELIELSRPSEVERIRALPNDKYFMYKQKALVNYNPSYSACCPRSGKIFYKWTFDWKSFGALPPCHKAPNDTKRTQNIKNKFIKTAFYLEKYNKFVYLRKVK